MNWGLVVWTGLEESGSVAYETVRYAGLVEAVISVELGGTSQAGPQTVATSPVKGAKARLVDWSAVSDSNGCHSSYALYW